MNNSHYDTHPLRAYVANRLELFHVPDPIWNKGIMRRYVQRWSRTTSANEKIGAQDELVEVVREDMKAVENMGVDITPWKRPGKESTKRGTAVELDISANDPIALRADALRLYWAKLAEAGQRVRQFRKDQLDGGVASESEARNFMHSPAASQLNSVAADLCRRYPWELKDAAWFVLTGVAPAVPPLTAHINRFFTPGNQGTITITAAYWVPKTAISEFYAEVKGEVKARIRDIAPTPSPRRLALFRFVVERSQGIDQWESLKPEGPRSVHDQGIPLHVQGLRVSQWRSLQAQWNEEYPEGQEWHYSDHRNLRRDFREAFKALVGYWPQ
jgi:hypothetical protein